MLKDSLKIKNFEKDFFLGPMSKNVVDAILSFNSIHHGYFGIIPSRRQIECKSLGSGYVNNWSTRQFLKHVGKDTLVLRDHAGPSQGLKTDDGKKSIKRDIISGIKFIHIDPWKVSSSIEEAIEKTANLVKYCNSIDSNCYYEIGTEEAIYSYSPKELFSFVSGVSKKLGELFSRVIYCVVQSGTSVKGLGNIGNFNKEKSKEMSDICHSFSIKSKEHNSDYLSEEDIVSRLSCGVDSLNIAPELGVIETSVIIKRLKNLKNERDEFFNLCYSSGKWRKWVEKEPDLETISKICGHYLFANKRFYNIKSKLGSDIDLEIKHELNKKLVSLWKIKK